MKTTDMNQHQYKANSITKEIYCDIVGGAENAILDKAEGYEGWQILLNDHEAIKQFIYDEVIGLVEGKGKEAKHIKFAGKDFIMDIIERRLIKDGY